MRILIADDHMLYRDSLATLLAEQGHVIVAQARTGRQAVELARRLAPDLVLMDIGMPELDGIEATRILTTDAWVPKVVILSGIDDEDKLFAAMKAGADGYLSKQLEADALFVLLERIACGDLVLTPGLARKVLRALTPAAGAIDTDDPDVLTEREGEVLELLAQGLTTNRRLAKMMVVSESTVKFHVRNILDKLHHHGRLKVAAGILHAPEAPSRRDGRGTAGSAV